MRVSEDGFIVVRANSVMAAGRLDHHGGGWREPARPRSAPGGPLGEAVCPVGKVVGGAWAVVDVAAVDRQGIAVSVRLVIVADPVDHAAAPSVQRGGLRC